MSEKKEKEATKKPSHKATYTRKRTGYGFNIRVIGPHADKFSGREVPVVTKAGAVNNEKLMEILWCGKDRDTDENVAIYSFLEKPREEKPTEEIPF